MLKNVLIFLAGAAVGAVSAIKIKEYIDSQKEEIEEEIEETESDDEEDELEERKSLNEQLKREVERNENFRKEKEKEINKYKDLLEKTKYDNPYADYHATHGPEDDLPTVISQDDCGDCGYEIETLRFYEEDGLIVDYTNTVWSPADVSDAIGEEWRDIIESGADTVYVRNDRIEIDYEIERMEGSFDDEIGGN